MIKAAADDFFATAGEPFNLTLESGDPYLIRCLVSDGFRTRCSPPRWRAARARRSRRARSRPPVRLPVYVIWRRDRHRSAAATALVEFVREAIPGRINAPRRTGD